MKKAIYLFALFVFFNLLASCTSDDLAEDESLYITEDVFASGGDEGGSGDDGKN